MRKSHLMFLVVTLIASICVPAFADDAAATAPAGVVNINTADAAQLSLLPRVGSKAAQLIVAYRTQHGPFKKATDLMQVKGIGDKTFEGLSRYIILEGKTTLSAKVSSPRKPRSAKAKPTSTASN